MQRAFLHNTLPVWPNCRQGSPKSLGTSLLALFDRRSAGHSARHVYWCKADLTLSCSSNSLRKSETPQNQWQDAASWYAAGRSGFSLAPATVCVANAKCNRGTLCSTHSSFFGRVVVGPASCGRVVVVVVDTYSMKVCFMH